MSQRKKGWGKTTVTAMYTSKENLTPLLYSGKIKKKKKNNIMQFETTWMELETLILSEISKKDRQIPYDINYNWNLIYTMEYYSAIKKNDIMPFAATWMELENLILSEMSQKDKDKYHMISLITGI